MFAKEARELLSKERVAAVFGCWTSASRKAVLPIFEQLNGLLFYPVQYEGEESSRNIFYTGAAPNQ
jgi:urea transport system substrate-binding protein